MVFQLKSLELNTVMHKRGHAISHWFMVTETGMSNWRIIVVSGLWRNFVNFRQKKRVLLWCQLCLHWRHWRLLAWQLRPRQWQQSWHQYNSSVSLCCISRSKYILLQSLLMLQCYVSLTLQCNVSVYGYNSHRYVDVIAIIKWTYIDINHMICHKLERLHYELKYNIM